jgi:hypothetical protein
VDHVVRRQPTNSFIDLAEASRAISTGHCDVTAGDVSDLGLRVQLTLASTAMSANLYEILEIEADATPEQSTPPLFCCRSSLSQTRIQFERHTRNGHFRHTPTAPRPRKRLWQRRIFVRWAPSQFHIMHYRISYQQVNNAYEVLIDPQKRQSYDRHSVWPPPTEDPPRHTQNNARSYPFHPNVFTFTDPFELFDSFFGHPNPFHDPFPFGPSRAFPDPFFAATGPLDYFGPFGPFNSGPGAGSGPIREMFVHDPFMLPMMGGGLFQSQATGGGGRSAPYFSSGSSSYLNHQGAGGSQWISDSRSTSTVNGLTASVHERVDSLVRISSSV